MNLASLRRRPSGFSLLEAIVAVGIFIGSMALIGQLLDVGLRMVDVDKYETQALLRAESTMEEIVAGIRPINLEGTREPIIDLDDPRWRTHILIEPTEVESLLRVTVVTEFLADPAATTEEEATHRQSLTRLVADWSLLAVPATPGGPAGTITVPQMLGIGASGGGG